MEAVLLAQFGSVVEEHGMLMFAVFVIPELAAVPTLTFTTNGKLAVALTASVEMVQVIVPVVAPTAGRVPQFQPAGTPNETKLVPVGIVSVKVAVPEAAGPLLRATCV